jgi:death-on-curing protein
MDEHRGLQFFYFKTSHAIIVHDWIIEKSGGLSGVAHIGYLEGPLDHIRNDEYYPEVADKLTHLIYSINKNHAFNDGNKRSSIALGAYFMELNGYDYAIRRFVYEMENVAVCVASNHINKDLLLQIVESLVYEEEFSEPIKLALVDAFASFAADTAN